LTRSVAFSSFTYQTSHPIQPTKSFLSTLSATTVKSNHYHIVNGIECVEVPIELPSLGRVTVLEATAASQEYLVNMALEVDEDHEDSSSSSSLSSDLEKLNAGDPYGAVLWPAAYAIAEKLLSDPNYRSKLQHQTILELGAGTGLVSLALSLAGAKHVIATDYETIPLKLMEYSARYLNPKIVSTNTCLQIEDHSISYQLLDMRDYSSPLPAADVVVATDIMYEPKTGTAMARRAVEALQRGSTVLVGDSPGRPGRQAFLEELKRLGVQDFAFVDTIGFTCSGPRHELICGKGSTSVSNNPQGMKVAVMQLDPNCHFPSQQ